MGVYLTVATGTGTADDPRRPKYFAEITPSVGWTAMDYGSAFLVRADLDNATEAALNPNADFFTVPALSSNLTAGQVTGLQNRLEPSGIPAGWIDTTYSWRQVLRRLAAMFILVQRSRVNVTQASLDLTLGSLSANTRQALRDAATSLDVSLDGITNAMTVRQALKVLADRWPPTITFGAFALEP